jgi:hypothetical protein
VSLQAAPIVFGNANLHLRGEAGPGEERLRGHRLGQAASGWQL